MRTAANPAGVDQTTPPGALLAVQDLTVSFATDDGMVRAVDAVSWSVRAGETLGIVGESGAGKSVSALAILGLLPPEPAARVSGRILFADQDLLQLREAELRQIRGNRISMIFQDPLSALNPVFKVGHQISEVLQTHGSMGRVPARARAVELLAEVGIANPKQRASEYPHQFSGGMRQRALIAMALARDPVLLLADEPTTALDATVRRQVVELLFELQQRRGTAIVIISHDMGLIASTADRVLVMYAGRVAETADVDTLFSAPRHAYTLGLLSSVTRLDEPQRQRFDQIPGQPPSLIELPSGCAFHPRCRLATPVCAQEVPHLLAAPGTQAAACHHSDAVALAADARRLAGEGAVSLWPGTASACPGASPPPLLEVEALVKDYPVSARRMMARVAGVLRAVDGVSFAISPGHTLGLVGESGCGKSTVAHAVLRLTEATSGSIRFQGEDLLGAAPGRMRELRRELQGIFQDPYASLNPRMKVANVLREPFRIHDLAEGGAVAELLEAVGLGPEHASRYAHELSGGQRQRVGIARALALGPRLVICDEPVSALDVSVQAQILNLLRDLQQNRQLAYLFITHDMAVVRHMADQVAVMYLGQVVEMAGQEALFAGPAHPYTQALISAVPVPDPRRQRSRIRIVLSGDPPSPAARARGCQFQSRCPKFAQQLDADERERCLHERPALAAQAEGHSVACHYAEPVRAV